MSIARTVSFAPAVIATGLGLALAAWVSGAFFLLAFLAFAGPVGSGDGGV